jgi:preprotein translocase subunit SecD
VNRTALWASLLGSIAVAVGLLAINLGFGTTPVLGLDLRGGVSVILAPTSDASEDDLLVIRDLIRDELEQRGIAEPDVRVEGANIVVDLPGVRDQQDALDAVDVAGIVTLRPVYQCGLTTGEGEPTDTTAPAAPTDSTTPSESTPSSTPETTPETTDGGPSGFRRPVAAPAQDDATTPTVPVDPVTGETIPLPAPFDPSQVVVPPAQPVEQDVLPIRDTNEACLVGPSGGSGEVFARGSAGVDLDQFGAWIVTVDLRGDGEATWNALASQCFATAATCPSGQLAIVLDDVIQSAPVVNAPSFSGGVTISGDFTESEARDLARVLNRGAFPVNVEAQTVQTVSPTLGNDSLRAAIISGLIGAGVVMVLMVALYRKLSVVVLVGLVLWGMLVYSAAALVSHWTNYALTLAGATGIIVSVGAAVDSYVVLFERLKDEQRAGRRLRSAAPRSFRQTWRTILAANLVSILAAAILFWLSVGSVKGFALYLGLTAICGLLVAYFFSRPAVILLVGTKWFEGERGAGARDAARTGTGTTGATA